MPSLSCRDELLAALRRVLPATPGIAVIHSSLAGLAPPASLGWADATYALSQLVRAGWTVALPSFTFSFCGGGRFDAGTSRSETGILADWLLGHFHDAIRTPHPIYSFAALGPRAAAIAACAGTTTFGDDSPFGLFERERAQLLMLGCGWEFATQFHRCEEQARVPYRYPKRFSGVADYGAGPAPVETTMWVRDLDIDARNDFSPAIDRLREAGAIATAPLWRSRVEAVAVEALAAVGAELLAADPFAFVREPGRVAHACAAKSEAAATRPLRLAVLGDANLHLLETAWRERMAALLPERRLEWLSLPFGQTRQAMIDPDSALRRFAPDLQVFCDRLSDIAGEDLTDAAAVLDRVSAQAARIARYHQANGGWSLIHRFAVLAPSADSDAGLARAELCARANAILDAELGGMRQIAWIDLAAEAAAHPGPVFDPRLWFTGRFPFDASFSRRLAERWCSLTLAVLGKSTRLVVVDLDNTLWGGVLGEDGVEGLAIGGDYPGNAYAAFQRHLKALTRRGIALAIASKNDTDLALRALETLPAMVLRPGDFSAHRINWQPKWRNLREIAAELALGEASILFIDDNPAEREAIRRNLPAVRVLDLPADPTGYVDALESCPYLAAATVTAEDRGRIEDYARRRERTQARSEAASLEDFFAGLEMRLTLAPLMPGNGERAAQLCQKTNQFNTTTRRYGLRDLEALRDGGADVVVIGLEDRQSPFENIGLLILRPEEDGAGRIDLYLLSCRVLGRGLETAVPRWAVLRAARRHWPILRGEIIPTERNSPARGVFAAAGFDDAGEGHWTIETTSPPALPAWLTVIDRVNQP